MRAVILAAGRGSRMEGMTDSMPKCFAVLQGKRLVDWQYEAFRGAGIEAISIVRGYLPDAFDLEDVHYFENTRWEKTNMVRSLLSAHTWMAENDCIVSYADVVYPASTIQALADSREDIVISYNSDWESLWNARFDHPLDDAETFRIDAKGRLMEIGGNAQSMSDIEGQYMGLLRFTPAGWRRVHAYLSSLAEDLVDALDMTSLLQRLVERGIPIQAIPIHGQWLEVDNQQDLVLYERMFARKPLFSSEEKIDES